MIVLISCIVYLVLGVLFVRISENIFKESWDGARVYIAMVWPIAFVVEFFLEGQPIKRLCKTKVWKFIWGIK